MKFLCPEPTCRAKGVKAMLVIGAVTEVQGIDVGLGVETADVLDSWVACTRCEWAMTLREILQAGEAAAA